MDGTPTLRLNEFMLASLAANKIDLGAPRSSDTRQGLAEPVELKFVLDENVKGHIERAEKAFDDLVSEHDMHVSESPEGLARDVDLRGSGASL
jgi:carnitine O-acetyltransferase